MVSSSRGECVAYQARPTLNKESGRCLKNTHIYYAQRNATGWAARTKLGAGSVGLRERPQTEHDGAFVVEGVAKEVIY